MKFSSIAIVGAGAIGSYYGARLALNGADVRFLLRSDLDAVRERGLTLHEKDATRVLHPVAAFGRSEEIGPVDLAIVTVKTTANASLTDVLPPLMGPGTTVLTLQNGLGNEEHIAAIVGAERVLGGLCYVAVTRGGPGVLECFHTPGAITFGEYLRPAGPRVRAVAEKFEAFGVRTRLLDDLAEARWQKLVWNVPFNGLGIVGGGVATDEVLRTPQLAEQVRPLMDEVANAGRRLGYEITESFIQAQIDVTPPLGAYRPSSVVDFGAGREVELEAIWGEPLRRSEAAGVAVPRLAALYRELKRAIAARAGEARIVRE